MISSFFFVVVKNTDSQGCNRKNTWPVRGRFRAWSFSSWKKYNLKCQRKAPIYGVKESREMISRYTQYEAKKLMQVITHSSSKLQEYLRFFSSTSIGLHSPAKTHQQVIIKQTLDGRVVSNANASMWPTKIPCCFFWLYFSNFLKSVYNSFIKFNILYRIMHH